MTTESLEFGSFRLDPAQGRVTKAGRPLPLGARAIAILRLLAERAPAAVGAPEIMGRVWPDLFVEEANIRVHVSALRKALGEGHGIVNHPGRGYALSLAVRAGGRDGALSRPGATLVGREADIAALGALLPRQRLTTLLGVGGVGKTSLALAVAQDLAGSFAQGVTLVDLSALPDASLAVGRVATTLGLRLADADSAAELAAALRDQQRLLILDTCEHVLDGIAPLAERFQTEAPALRLLATSREPLRVEGEYLYRLAPLALPAGETAADAAAAPAMRLLLERAAAGDPPWWPGAAELPLAIRLCRALDGIPLAIELAAARLGTLPLATLVQDLSRQLATPVPGQAPVVDRHRTLAATLDWSHRLLPAAERSLLLRLGIFRGPFTLAGAVAVGAATGTAPGAGNAAPRPAEVAEALAELIDRSLVAADLGGEQPWYRLLDTIRDDAAARLAASGDRPAVARCHLDRVRARLEDLATPRPMPPEQRQRENRRLLDDLLAALDWAFGPEGDAAAGVRLAAAAGPFFMQLTLVGENRRQAGRALAALAGGAPPDPVAETRLLATLALATFHADGPTQAVRDAYARALALAERAGDLPMRRHSLWGLWTWHFGEARYAEALHLIRDYADCTPPDQDPLYIVDRATGMTLTFLGELSEGRRHAERVLARPAPQGGNILGAYQFEPRSATRALLARTLWLQGCADQARDAARESLEEARASGHGLSLCFSLTVGHCLIAMLAAEPAAALEGAALLLETARRDGLPFWGRYGTILRQAASAMLGRPQAPRGEFLAAEPWSAGHREFLAVLGLGHHGPDGIDLIDPDRPSWIMPEVLRLEAMACARTAPARAALLLDRAAAMAEAQGAGFWTLRVALSRAQALDGCGDAARAEAARAGVAAALERLTEGFDTPDRLAAERFLRGPPRCATAA
ncbi:winged helix-turn-helix domain-containing protein [Roseomonas sp. NAR14]|uniref:Winged helix-turn-helix domain-containing protein n=1 Tax=Roseomonas acroporae TaxID=2937791 RepID=A0A9X1YEA2_9PROT|nr:winged helix-turn-helix domain-containing protein [Roseomonas acroporae]MCK8787553.1 winged helix-turn-helix domain-containing protein [Roseomonas acroporae]